MSSQNVTNIPCASNTPCLINFIIIPTVIFFLGAVIFSGNVLTLTALWKTTALQTVANINIASLACADLLMAAFCFARAFMSMQWSFAASVRSKELCLFLIAVATVSQCSSNFSIASTAIDRFIYIVYPFKYDAYVTKKSTTIMIATTWVISVAFGFGVIHFNNFDEYGICSFFHIMHSTYEITSQTAPFFLTFLVNVFAYTKIISVALHQQKAVAACDNTGRSTLKQSMKGIRLLLLVCGLYLCCWMPFHVHVCITTSTGVFPAYFVLLFLAGVLNSAMNFVIYTLMNKDFRRAFKRILTCRSVSGGGD